MNTSCCLQSNTDTARLFSWLARWNRLHHRLFGLEPNQRQLLEGVRAQNIDGASLLEIGCGAGYVHQALMRDGAAHATGVDLSGGMLDIARGEAARRDLQTRCDYLQGDAVKLADHLPIADVTILDKVVCCYPNWRSMLDVALTKTGRVCALTYPLDRGLTRLGVRLLSRALDLFHCCYRPYLHDPIQIRAYILSRDFRLVSARTKFGWLTEIYLRQTVRNTSFLHC